MDLGAKCKIQNYKTSRSLHRENLDDLGCDNEFLGRTREAQSMKEKNDVRVGFKVKKSCSAKDTAGRLKRPARDWEKIPAKHISDEECCPKYTRSSNSTMRKRTLPGPACVKVMSVSL